MVVKLFTNLILILFAINLQLVAQPTWFPENAEWYYFTICPDSPNCGYQRYNTDGDTLINGVSAHVLRGYLENSWLQIEETGSHYFRFADDTVFYYSSLNEDWGLLYDFNAQPGDVWDLSVTLTGLIGMELDEDYNATVVVDSVTQEMIGGESRKLIHTSPQPFSNWGFFGPILEGVGAIGDCRGLFGEPIMNHPAISLPRFSCYRENGEVIVGTDGYPCGVVSSVAESVPLSFIIFPNPTTSIVHIELSHQSEWLEVIRLYDQLGKQVRTYAATHFPLTLDLSDLPAGVYVLEGRTSLEKRVISRLMIAPE